jgi:lipoprotein
MKKLVFSLAVLFSVAMVSCGGNKAAEATDTDTMVAVEETVVEAVDSNDTTVAVEAAAEVAEAPAADSAK